MEFQPLEPFDSFAQSRRCFRGLGRLSGGDRALANCDGSSSNGGRSKQSRSTGGFAGDEPVACHPFGCRADGCNRLADGLKPPRSRFRAT